MIRCSRHCHNTRAGPTAPDATAESSLNPLICIIHDRGGGGNAERFLLSYSRIRLSFTPIRDSQYLRGNVIYNRSLFNSWTRGDHMILWCCKWRASIFFFPSRFKDNGTEYLILQMIRDTTPPPTAVHTRLNKLISHVCCSCQLTSVVCDISFYRKKRDFYVVFQMHFDFAYWYICNMFNVHEICLCYCRCIHANV